MPVQKSLETNWRPHVSLVSSRMMICWYINADKRAVKERIFIACSFIEVERNDNRQVNWFTDKRAFIYKEYRKEMLLSNHSVKISVSEDCKGMWENRYHCKEILGIIEYTYLQSLFFI